jgi:uncharacterized protein
LAYPNPQPRAPRLGRAFAPLLLAPLLGGCLGGKVEATRFYILTPTPAGAQVEAAPAGLAAEVAAVDLPEHLDRPQIVIRASPHRLEMSDGHQWGGQLRKDIARVLGENLTHRAAILAEPARVELRVLRFERMPDGRVTLATHWTLALGAERRPTASRLTELHGPTVAEDDYEGIARTMSALLDELAQVIAAALPTRP